MAQKTFVDGDVLTASDINTYLAGEGGAWTSFTPTVTQSGSVTVTNNRSVYARYGRTIHFSINLTVTGSGTGSNNILISLPVAAAAAEQIAGSALIIDISTGGFGTQYKGLPSVLTGDTSSMVLLPTNTTSAGVLGGTGMTAGLASGDTIKIAGTYEAAS